MMLALGFPALLNQVALQAISLHAAPALEGSGHPQQSKRFKEAARGTAFSHQPEQMHRLLHDPRMPRYLRSLYLELQANEKGQHFYQWSLNNAGLYMCQVGGSCRQMCWLSIDIL